MELQHLGALALFAFVASFTPGPNNIMLMASGANVGFTRTIPHMAGIILGFALMLILVGLGLTGLFNTYPMLREVLKVLCLAYLVYLAWKIARSAPGDMQADYRPMTLLQAAMFQWVNPKGWSMALTAVSLFNPSASLLGLVIIAGIFILVNIPVTSFWAAAGIQLKRWLTSQTRVRRFNLAMALLLVGSTVPML